MKCIPEIDLDELVRYADSKNVGLILWAVSYVLDKKLDEAFKYYSGMGIKGFKVDFIDRDDQEAVDMVERISQKAADYHLLLDFHGMWKPAGLNRRYPNILNFEGVFGEEQVKWEKELVHPEYDATFPYIRMFSGPVDYTQGAMRNGTKKTYQSINSQPMSQGTRSHQIAGYVVFDSPLEMLCDSPSAYEREQATTDFITSIPVVWDETRVLSGEVGKNIVVMRRKGNEYYIGALGNWDDQDLSANLSFLDKNAKYNAVIYRDGANADHIGEDFVLESKTVTSDNALHIHLAQGGGYAAKLTRAD
jgi:alpha-glucosidase